MNARSLKILAVIVVALFAAMIALNSGEHGDKADDTGLLFPELKARLNDLNSVTIEDAEGEITLRREEQEESAAGRWIVPEHDNFPADTGKLRQLLLALADARKLERKTSDPELYSRLGVEDPRNDDEAGGVLVTARGNEASVNLILGDPAQREFRYARIPEEAQSWLIDQNPDIPDDSTGWLLPDIVDIDAGSIKSASIRHADGESVRITKDDRSDTNFQVEEIPAGRELRYPSVANGIAGVLDNLTLENVRSAGQDAQEPSAVAEYLTFDGLKITVDVYAEDAESDPGEDDADPRHWIALKAEAVPAAENATSGDQAAGEEPVDATESADAATAGETAPAGPGEEAEETPAGDRQDPSAAAADINERVGGWLYEISSYKVDQLTRRWDDLLSEPATEDDE